MVATIRIQDDQITPALKQLDRQLVDMGAMMREISETMVASIEEAFDTETDPDTGQSWQPLALSTQRQRTRKGSWPGKMLQISQGGLASSIWSDSSENQARAGVSKVYGAIHHFGGQAGRNRATEIPARPFLGLFPQHREAAMDAVRRALKRAAALR